MAKKRSSPVDLVIEAANDLVNGAHDVVVPITKGAAKELHKLEDKLADARHAESKRFRQLAAAQAGKGKKHVTKRTKQAGRAAADVARLAGRVAEIVGEAIGSATHAAVGAAADIGQASVRAAEAVSPVKAPPTASPAPAKASTAKAATAKAPTAKAPTAKASTKPAAKRRPSTRRTTTAKPRAPRKPASGA